MHILLLNEYYPPDTSATAKMAAQVVEVLARRHQVTVVAGRPSYDPTMHYPYALLRREKLDGITVERVGSTAFPRHQMRRRVSNYLSYLALAVPRAMAIRPDVVLAMTDPPIAGIAGAFVARMVGRPFVYNIRDLYPEMAVGGDIVRPGKSIELWERMHRRTLKQAARVIVLGDDMRKRILAKGIAPEKVVVVRDGASPPASTPDVNDPATARTLREIRCGFSFVVLHAGNLGFYGAWGALLKAAEILRDGNIGFVFVGGGANLASVKALAGDSPNVRFLPFRPVEELPHVMLAGDLHVVTVRRGLEGVVVPSKLYSTLAAGRPVLAVADAESDAARVVADSGCGVAADPDDPAAIAAAIRGLRDDPARLAQMARQARATAEKYARVTELERFTAIVEDATSQEKGGDHLGS